MSETLSLFQVARRFRKYLIISIIVCMVMVPVADAIILQRDRNRNMVFGELFWSEGLNVYNINDTYLNETYGVPADHLLTGIVNVTYEYPVITLLFYAFVALIEPGMFGPHWLVNWLLVLFAHINLILFLYIGRKDWNKKWFRQFFAVFYAFEVIFSVGFAKTEPLTDMFWLIAIIFWRQDRRILANSFLAIATQTKLYPAMVFPILLAADPISSIAFLVVNLLFVIPLFASQIMYGSLIAHLSNSASYSTLITNPFYLGLVFTNPLAIIAPSILVIALALMIFETKRVGFVEVPTRRLRTSDWRTILIFALPLTLIVFSWVLIWYYSWFIIPMLLLDRNEDKSAYRKMIAAIWMAHFTGILLNFNYFMNGPIAEFLGHMR